MGGSDDTCRTIYVNESCPAFIARREEWSLEQFTFDKKIGCGYASVVRLARCNLSGIRVAIKMYVKHRLSELNHFQINREINIHSSLSHNNIIQLLGAFEDRHGIYLVTEYASGGDLFSCVEKCGGQLSEEVVVKQVIRPFLSALLYLHEKKVIHRDIKPENVLLTSAGKLKLADFGLSIDFGVEAPVTRVGTLDYMSPEVVICPDKQHPMDNKENVKIRYSTSVDCWAVGVLAFELVVGKPPFDKGHKRATIEHILRHSPHIPQGPSDGFRDFVSKALSKKAAQRPTILQLIEHPWVRAYVSKPQTKDPALRPVMGRAISFVGPTPLKAHRSSNGLGSGHASVTPAKHIRKQVPNLRTALPKAASMDYTQMMRWRDVAFEANAGEGNFGRGGNNYTHALLPARLSDDCDLESYSRQGSGTAPRSPGMSRTNSFIRGRSSVGRMSSTLSRDTVMSTLRSTNVSACSLAGSLEASSPCSPTTSSRILSPPEREEGEGGVVHRNWPMRAQSEKVLSREVMVKGGCSKFVERQQSCHWTPTSPPRLHNSPMAQSSQTRLGSTPQLRMNHSGRTAQHTDSKTLPDSHVLSPTIISAANSSNTVDYHKEATSLSVALIPEGFEASVGSPVGVLKALIHEIAEADAQAQQGGDLASCKTLDQDVSKKDIKLLKRVKRWLQGSFKSVFASPSNVLVCQEDSAMERPQGSAGALVK